MRNFDIIIEQGDINGKFQISCPVTPCAPAINDGSNK